MEKKVDEIKQKKAVKDIILDIVPYVVIVIVVVIIRSYIATPIRVNGSSMYPILEDGETMILNKIGLSKGINRFDIVVIKSGSGYIIKRVIALPGETIYYENNTLYIDGKKTDEEFLSDEAKNFTCDNNYDYELCKGPIKVDNDKYFVMGDNREVSKDSRMIGQIYKDSIIGKTNIVIFPFSKMGIVRK